MTTFNTSREIPATVEQVFAAISDPERLARWGGAGRFHQYVQCLKRETGQFLILIYGVTARRGNPVYGAAWRDWPAGA